MSRRCQPKCPFPLENASRGGAVSPRVEPCGCGRAGAAHRSDATGLPASQLGATDLRRAPVGRVHLHCCTYSSVYSAGTLRQPSCPGPFTVAAAVFCLLLLRHLIRLKQMQPKEVSGASSRLTQCWVHGDFAGTRVRFLSTCSKIGSAMTHLNHPMQTTLPSASRLTTNVFKSYYQT